MINSMLLPRQNGISATRWLCTWCVLFLACLAAPASADSWLPPQTRTYTSLNTDFRLIVTPREIASQLRYFSDASKNKPKPGQKKGAAEQATFRLEKRDSEKKWQLVSAGSLVNDVAPVDAVIANDGAYFVTFDNWHSMGYGDNAVAIYRSDGTLVRKMGLTDFLPESYVNALPRSISSLHWRKAVRIDDAARTVIVDVVVPSQSVEERLAEPGTIQAHLSLIDGSLQNSGDAGWLAALATGATEAGRQEAEEKRRKAEFIAPLLAPKSSDEAAWHQYLVEVFFRIDPDWQNGYPRTHVLRDPKRKDYSASEQWLRETLLQKETNADVVTIASPASQDNLVAVLAKLAPRIKPASLSNARIYVSADETHGKQIADLFLPSQAKIIILDPATPITQRSARIPGTPEYERAQQESRDQSEKEVEGILGS